MDSHRCEWKSKVMQVEKERKPTERWRWEPNEG